MMELSCENSKQLKRIKHIPQKDIQGSFEEMYIARILQNIIIRIYKKMIFFRCIFRKFKYKRHSGQLFNSTSSYYCHRFLHWLGLSKDNFSISINC